jgi:hypothetical protein
MIHVLGSRGSTGKRYLAILKYLKIPCTGSDVQEPIPAGDASIIATPDIIHRTNVEDLMQHGYKRFLIEKPVSRYPEDIVALQKLPVTCHMVCNWRFVEGMLPPGQNSIDYNSYNWGKPGRENAAWNLAQLIYLSAPGKLHVSSQSPIWACLINDRPVRLGDIEKSYVDMIQAWIDGHDDQLWTLDDAKLMTEKCLYYERGQSAANGVS